MNDDIITLADLRVNNYYFIGHKIYKLDLGLLMAFASSCEADLKGIPLIPSILDGAGFFEHPDKIFIDKSDRVVIRFWDDGQIHVAFKREGARLVMPDNVLTELRYIHELQSLYYFLTLEELNIQL